MENTSWFFFALAFIAALGSFLSNAFMNKTRPKKNPPPGPKPLPIIGNLHLLGENPHRALDLLSKKYGDIMQLKFGSCPVVIASSPDMAEQFLKVHDANFASRPITAAGKYTSCNYCDMTWAPYGPYWRQARRIYLTEIFNPKRLESFEYIRSDERRALISRLYALRGKPVVVKDHLSRYTLSSISRTVLSNKYFAYDSKAGSSTMKMEELSELIDKWFWLNGVFNIGDWIPWLSPLDLQGYVRQMKDLGKKFDEFHNFVLDDHKARMAADENFVPKDMVDVLLQLAEDPNLEIKLTEDCIKGLMQDLLTGGTDTSATTVEWALTQLLKNPQYISKATEELDRVVGRERWVEEKDISELAYIDAIIKETVRLHPLATFLAPHYAIQDCKVAGYDIAKGTTILINTWSMGRNPKFWDSPEEFRPERFYGKDIDMSGQDFSLLPFGSGRRRCPGYSLGLKLVRTTLANLLHGFNWKLPDGMKPGDICLDEVYGLTSHPKISLAIVMEPRLAAHLY